MKTTKKSRKILMQIGMTIMILALGLVSVGCVSTTLMKVNVVDTDGEPITEATVKVDGKTIGKTPNAETRVSNFILKETEIRVTKDGYLPVKKYAAVELKIANLALTFVNWFAPLWLVGPKSEQRVVMSAEPIETPEPTAQEPAPQETVPKKDSTGITFYIPFYNPDPMSFFLSEYQNALANQKKFNWYLTAFYEDKGRRGWGGEGHSVNRGAFSTGLIAPLWHGQKGNSWSLIGHYTIVGDSMEPDSMPGVQSIYIYNFDITNYFAGGGLRADYGSVSVGFIGGGYSSSLSYQYWSSNVWSPGDHSIDIPLTGDVFKFSIPLRFGLSEQIFFIDKFIGNVAFDKDFVLTQLLSQLVFTTLNIGTMRLGMNLYYKNEDYNMVARQQLIGASFNTKYLQLDGGYRFFTMTGYLESLIPEPPFEDGLYGRMVLKLPFGKRNALAFSVSLDDPYQSDGVDISFGIGISLFGSAWQTRAELDPNLLGGYLGTHVNLRANE